MEAFFSGYSRILEGRNFILLSILLVAASFLASAFSWTVALRDYAPSIAIHEAFLVAVSQTIGGLVTLTPGGTGFQEIAGIYVGHRFQITTVELFAVLVWTKLARMAIAFLLAIPSLIVLKRGIQGSALERPVSRGTEQ